MDSMTVRFSAGSILKIPVSGERFAYGVMLAVRPYFAFFSDVSQTEESVRLGNLVGSPLFVVSVYSSAYSRGRWCSVLGRVKGASLPPIPHFFRQNALNLNDCEIVDAQGNVQQASPAECVGLERSAVWAAEHVEQRIDDIYAGRPNAFVESMKLKLQ